MDTLDISFECDDLGRTVTIREYLMELLLTLWREEEGFSGKRPFGNSGWQGDLHRELVRAKVVPGELDDEGYLDWCDESVADVIAGLIRAMCARPA